MHIPDGFIDGPTSIVAGLVAITLVAWSLRMTARTLDEREVPIVGLVAAFVFAVQMLNFAVLPGVSGHLLGGALATILVGPAVGALCVSVVLIVQALLFADGGLTALGLNITNMALTGSLVAGLVVVALLRVLPRTKPGLLTATVVTALFSVLAGAAMFVVEYRLGGTLELSLATVARLQLGYHLLIGLGEGAITAATVWTVAQVRPDLIWALRRSGWALGTPVPVPAAITGSAT